VYDFTRTVPLCYVLVNNGGYEIPVGVVLKLIVFSFYVYIPLFLLIVCLHILRLKNETNIPFALTAKLCM